jgi:uncharacterized SAM-binding protein YcdF (DUF218 family)
MESERAFVGWRRRLAALVVLMVAAAGIVSIPDLDEVGDVDAVVVLGGGGGERLAVGRELAVAREVPLVLAGDSVSEAALSDLTCDATLPEAPVTILCVTPDPLTTAGEARAASLLAQERGWDRIAVATTAFHVDRARLLFGQCLGRDAVDVTGASDDVPVHLELYRRSRELLGRLAAVTIRPAC